MNKTKAEKELEKRLETLNTSAIVTNKEHNVLNSILEVERKKSIIEDKAWDELSNAFSVTGKCEACSGYGTTHKGGPPCTVCGGTGLMKKVNMRAVELVLGPKYPKTTVNVNASLDQMSTNDLLNALKGII
jgi:hypothetical protein